MGEAACVVMIMHAAQCHAALRGRSPAACGSIRLAAPDSSPAESLGIQEAAGDLRKACEPETKPRTYKPRAPKVRGRGSCGREGLAPHADRRIAEHAAGLGLRGGACTRQGAARCHPLRARHVRRPPGGAAAGPHHAGWPRAAQPPRHPHAAPRPQQPHTPPPPAPPMLQPRRRPEDVRRSRRLGGGMPELKKYVDDPEVGGLRRPPAAALPLGARPLPGRGVLRAGTRAASPSGACTCSARACPQGPGPAAAGAAALGQPSRQKSVGQPGGRVQGRASSHLAHHSPSLRRSRRP
jgi:hypothetical protein